MSLHNLAKKVQSTGRGQDSMLVHMSPREVRGLEQLARIKGGALTRNPKTGLPEAGFLEDILPMVAAGAAIYFTAGAATPMLMSAGMGATSAGILAGAGAGAAIGAGSAAIQGKDVGNAALMGGITGAIGGGIGAPSGAEGAAPTLEQATTLGTNAIQVNPATGAAIDPLAANSGAGAGVSGYGEANMLPQGGMPQVPNGIAPPPTSAGQAATGLPAGEARNAALDNLLKQQGAFPENYAGLPGQGLSPTAEQSLYNAQSAANPPMNAGERIMKEQADLVAKNMKDPNASWWSKQTPIEKAGYTTLGAGLVAGFNAPPNDSGAPDEDYTSPLKRISPNFQAQEPIQPNPYYRARYPVYPTRAAEGGLMAAYQAGGPVERMTQANTAMNPQGGLYPQGMIDKTQYATPTQRPTSLEVVESEPNYEARTNPMTGTLMAGGGIASLGGYAAGGNPRLLKGPGDGMSDNIPATIAGKQPARLADGEFVVPADVVSHLGNGSTDAGAKRLYAMMDKVRTARTGKKKQAPAVNMNKYLPA
jgi:hypothetical protein